MSYVFLEMTMTLDGFTAGPEVSAERPLGIGGERVHAWLADGPVGGPEVGPPVPGLGAEGAVDAAPDEVDRSAAARMFETTGAFVLGRRTFDVGGGPWGNDEAFEGRPCFVMTSRPRDPVVRGGSTFEFVTGGIIEAITRASVAASAASVCILGGADVARQALASGLVDEVRLHLVPVILGGGARLFPDTAPRPIELQPLAVEQGALATHVRYRVLRPQSVVE